MERLTLAFKAPEQETIGSETAELVRVLEQLTLALKAPEQKADGNEVKALPAAREGDEEKPE